MSTAIHLSPDLLSGYLDGEVDAAERRAVDAHLADCPPCRARLAGLRRVVARLETLEQAAPPPLLAGDVARRVAIAERPTGPFGQLESALGRLPLESSAFLAFGLVVALAAILLIFVQGLQHAQAITSVLTTEEVTAVIVGERTFERSGPLWRERGAGEPARHLAEDAPEVLALLEAEPILRDLLATSDGVLLSTPAGDWLVEVR